MNTTLRAKNYHTMDNDNQSKLARKFKLIYSNEYKNTFLLFQRNDLNNEWTIVVDGDNIMFNHLQIFVEFIRLLGRPFVLDLDNNKINFIY